MPDFRMDLEGYGEPAYPTPFVHMVRWSKVWGCLPVRYRRADRLWKMCPFLTVWCLCSIGFNVPTFYDCIMTSISTDNSLTLYVMILIVGVMSITAVMMHVLSIAHGKEWATFFNGWMLFARKFPTLTVGTHSKRLCMPLFFGFFCYIAFFIINVLNELRFNLINDDGVGRMLSLVYVYVIYSFTLSTPVLWIVMASKVLTLCLCHIRRELDSIIECLSFGFRCTTSPIQKCIATGDMNRLQEAVLDLAKIIQVFKRIIGPYMLVIVPHHIVSLICFLYWTIVSMLDYTDWYFPLSFGLLSAQAILPIFVSAIYSEDVENQKEALVEPLIRLKGSMNDGAAKQKMATLIEHIDRLDAQINGGGFFTMNKGMATTVVNTVVTYLVVLIQFYGGSRR
ncbi:uncharacterized protein LOC143025338 [Oratosquilla oratoria]|uniref:uncharacterized protein LOC143025338 n=1 Tax=Oratosquilla oratoria TaxID=337810 RepID=UPI003F76D5EC